MKINKLSNEQKEFIVNNINLVHNFINNVLHVHSNSQDYEDYFQEGCLTFCKVIDKFDPSKGKLSSLLYSSLYNDLIEYKRKCLSQIVMPRTKRSNIIKMLSEGYSVEYISETLCTRPETVISIIDACNICSIEEPIAISKDGDEQTISDTVSDSYSNIEDIILDNKCYDIIDHISYLINEIDFSSDLHKQVYQEWIYARIYHDNLKQRELSDKYEISQPQIARIVKRYDIILKKLVEQELSNV